jgi:hypothetical protein
MNFTSFKIQRPMSRLSGLLLAAGFVIVAYVLHLMRQWDPLLAEEDHLMEWTQAAFLCWAGVSHFRRGRRNFGDPVAWAVFGGLALLCASFLARELDIDSWGTPLFGKTLEAVLRGLLIISWSCFARFLWKNFKLLYQAFPSTIGTPIIVLTVIGGSFYLASWPLEKELFSLPENTMKFWGQLLQIFACTLFFMSSLAKLPQLGGGRVSR